MLGVKWVDGSLGNSLRMGLRKFQGIRNMKAKIF